MAEQYRSNIGFKIVIAFLVVLLLGSLAYTYNVIKDSNEIEKVLISEKDAELKDLAISKDSLDGAIASNSILSIELINERDRVEKLIKDFQNSDIDAISAMKYKNDAINLKNKVSSLLKEVKELKDQNRILTQERDNAVVILDEAKKSFDNLQDKNYKMAETLEKASKLTVLNLLVESFAKKNSGKLVATDKARKTDIFKISYTIAENLVSKPITKNYFVQVVDNNNNVLGDMKIENFGDKSLTYSFVSAINFENQTLQMTKELKVENLTSGTYLVNIYDKGELLVKTSISLR